ncbi:MAG TPA: hypothetical protein VG225_07200 [Terracidiphilus sp.]|jgi:hypothetical protein|nr:hypothetical protein [Terracidiphilus sp.]
MEPNLRPLTLGEILDRTAQLYRTNFLLFAGISSVYAGAVLVLALGQIGLQEWMKAAHLEKQLLWANGLVVLLQMLVILVLSGIAVAANNRAVAWVHLGHPATVRGAYASVLPKTGRYVWLMVIIGFLVGWPLLLIYGGFVAALVAWLLPLSKGAAAGAAAGAAPAANPQLVLMLGILMLVFGALALAGLAYAVVMGLRYSLAVPACVVEDLKARKAIRRSVELSKGARGRIFLLGLLVFIIAFGLVMLAQGFFMIEIFKHHGQLSAGMRVLQQLTAFFTNTFVGPMYATGLTLFYYDQRVRKEGYDIEWMMQAAGLVPATGPVQPAEPVQAAPLEVAEGAVAESVAEGQAGGIVHE